MPYILAKKTRELYPPKPYRGLTCEWAGVEPGKVYTDLADALSDKARLDRSNPVGFEVVFVAKEP